MIVNMDFREFFVIIYVGMQMLMHADGYTMQSEQKLFKDLFTNYEGTIRPINNGTNTTTVYIGMEVNQFVELDEKKEIMDIQVLMSHHWQDDRLRWDPKDYSGLSVLRVPSSIVWRPDIVMYTGIGEDYNYNDERVVVLNTGMVLYLPNKRIRALCKVDVKSFPFDKQACQIQYGSWMYHGAELNLTFVGGNEKNGMRVSVESWQPWNLVNYSSKLVVMKYPCCEESFPSVMFTMLLERNEAYYLHIYVLPVVILSLLIPFQLFLPPESRERLTIGAVLVPSNILMIIKLREALPVGYSSPPSLAVYYSINLIWTFLSLLATIIVLILHNRGPRRGQVPEVLRTVFLRSLKHLVCLGDDTYYPLSSVETVMTMKSVENPLLSSPVHTKDGDHNTKLEKDVEELAGKVSILASRCRQQEARQEVIGEWHQIALVVDRVFIFLFIFTILVYTLVLIC